MWCQTILTAVAISYVICVLLLSGLQKEDLDASTLEKLGRHNVNIYDKNNDAQLQACLLNSSNTGSDNATQEHKPPVDQNVALKTTSNIKGDSKEVNITEYLKVEMRVPDNFDVKSILQNATENNKTESLLNQLKTLDENLKPNDVIDNLTNLGTLSKIEENNGLQIEYNMQNQSDLDGMMNFWTKLTHNTKTVVTKLNTTSAAPNVTDEKIISTTTTQTSHNNGYVHSREMEYISRILAEYMASQTFPTTTEQVNIKKNNTNFIFRKKELFNKTAIKEKNNSTVNINHIKQTKKVNNHKSYSENSVKVNKKQVLDESEYMPHKIQFDSHQESIQVNLYPGKVKNDFMSEEAKINEDNQQLKDIPYFERLLNYGAELKSPKPIDKINPIRFLDHLLKNDNDGIPIPYSEVTTDSIQPINQYKPNQYDIIKDMNNNFKDMDQIIIEPNKDQFNGERAATKSWNPLQNFRMIESKEFKIALTEKNIMDREKDSETVDENTRRPTMKISDEEFKLNNQYIELLSSINNSKQRKKLSLNNNRSKDNPVHKNKGEQSKIMQTIPSELEETPVLRIRKLKQYQNYDFKAMLPTIKNTKRNLNVQANNRLKNIIEMNKSQIQNIYEDHYKDAINLPQQGLAAINYQPNAEPVIDNFERNSNVELNKSQFNKPEEIKHSNQNQDSRTNYYQNYDATDNLKTDKQNPTLDLNDSQFKVIPQLQVKSNQFESSSNKYQFNSAADYKNKPNLYVNDNQFQIMPALQNQLNRIRDSRNNQYQLNPDEDNMKTPNLELNRNKLLAAIKIQSYQIQESRNNYQKNTKPDDIKNQNLYSNDNQFNLLPAIQNKLDRIQHFKNNNYQLNPSPMKEYEPNLNLNQFNMKLDVAIPSNQDQDSKTNYQNNANTDTINNPNLNSNQLNVIPVIKNNLESFQNYRNIPYNFNAAPENINNPKQNFNSRLNKNQINALSAATQLTNQMQNNRNNYQINAGSNTIKIPNLEIYENQFNMKPAGIKQSNPAQDSKNDYQINSAQETIKIHNFELNGMNMKPAEIQSQQFLNNYQFNDAPDNMRIPIQDVRLDDQLLNVISEAKHKLQELKNSRNNYQINAKPDTMKNLNLQHNVNQFNTQPEIKINSNRNPNFGLNENEINTPPAVTKRSNRIQHFQNKPRELIAVPVNARNPEQKPDLELNQNINIPVENQKPNRIQNSGDQFNTGPVMIEIPERNSNVLIQNNKPTEKRQPNPLKIENPSKNLEIYKNPLNMVPAVTKRSNQIQNNKNSSANIKRLQNKNVEVFNKRFQRLQEDVNILKEQQNVGTNTNTPESISPIVINEIAEKVKQIVLKDIRKDSASTDRTTMSTTSAAATTSTTVATTVTEKPTSVKDPAKEANTLMMKKLMEMFDEYKTLKKTVQTTTGAPLKSILNHQNPHPPNFPSFNYAPPPPAFNPYVVKGPPIYAKPIEVSPYGPGMVPIPISSGANLPKIPAAHYTPQVNNHPINQHRQVAITLQTNSNEIAPLAIQISKPLRLINQHIVVTTKNPYDKLKQEQERESKKRIDANFSNNSKEKNKHLNSDTAKKVRFSDISKRHEYTDRYFKAKFNKHKGKPKYKHEYGDIGQKDNLSHLGRPKGYHYPGYPRDYNHPGSSNQDEMSQRERTYSSSDNGRPRTRYEATKFHERLERIESWPRNGWKEYTAVTRENCSDDIPPRQQVPLNKVKKRTRFDDTHFTNFLKSQQKVTDMLEKILASNIKATAHRSVEV